jgi:hypothetical protein
MDDTEMSHSLRRNQRHQRGAQQCP